MVLRAVAVHMLKIGLTGVTEASECMLKGMPIACALPAGFMSSARSGPTNVE